MSASRKTVRRTFAATVCTAVMLCLFAGASQALTEPPPGPCDTPDSPVAHFVTAQYTSLLGRCPDAAGLAYWTDMLNRGFPFVPFIDLLSLSDEGVARTTNGWYDTILGRAPSPSEMSAAAAMLRADYAPERLVSTLAASDEFFNNLTSEAAPDARTATWLTVVYNSVLHRGPDSAGLAYFSNLLGTNSTEAMRFFVVMVIEHSAENAPNLVNAAFGSALGRSADSGGLTYWTAWLTGQGQWQTIQLRSLLAASEEGFALTQVPPTT